MSALLPGDYVRPVRGRLPRGRAADGLWYDTVDLALATPVAQATTDLHMSLAYEIGYLRGRRDHLHEDVAAAHDLAVRVVRNMAAMDDYATRSENSGEHERAQRVRAHWRETGLRS